MTSCTCTSAQEIHPSPKIYFPGAFNELIIEEIEDFVRFIGIWVVGFLLRR
jgi:hypothetical protein